MRRLAYISILIGVWLIGMAGLMLGLDDLLFGGRLPGWLLFSGAQLAAFSVVSLAEEFAEWLGKSSSKSVMPLPTGCPSPLGHS